MRIILLGLLALTLAACSRIDDGVQAGCMHSVEREITFSNPEAPDKVTARTEGPSCNEAVATLTLRAADGSLLWVYSTPYRYLTFGDGGAPDNPPMGQDVETFLGSWADLTLAKTSDLPEWSAAATSLGEAVDGLSYDTHLGRDAYEMLRARDLTDACFAISAEGSECIIMDPASNEALSVVRFGP